MNRLLVFYGTQSVNGNMRLGPTYYLDADYEPKAVRVYAALTPIADAKFDIFADGVSIFADNASKTYSAVTGYNTPTPVTSATLAGGENSEVYAEDFASDIETLTRGTWVHCNLEDTGGGNHFTVQLELEQLSEDNESKD